MLAVIVSPALFLPTVNDWFSVDNAPPEGMIWLAHGNNELSGICHDRGVKHTKTLSWQLMEAVGVEKEAGNIFLIVVRDE